MSVYTCPNCNSSLSNAEIVETDETAHAKGAPKDICPKCGSKLKVGVRNCPDCGEFLAIGKTWEQKRRSGNYYTNNGSSNTFLYVLSFLIPLVGIIAGAIFLTNSDESKKSAGKTCVILGLVGPALYVILIVILFSTLLAG